MNIEGATYRGISPATRRRKAQELLAKHAMEWDILAEKGKAARLDNNTLMGCDASFREKRRTDTLNEIQRISHEDAGWENNLRGRTDSIVVPVGNRFSGLQCVINTTTEALNLQNIVQMPKYAPPEAHLPDDLRLQVLRSRADAHDRYFSHKEQRGLEVVEDSDDDTLAITSFGVCSDDDNNGGNGNEDGHESPDGQPLSHRTHGLSTPKPRLSRGQRIPAGEQAQKADKLAAVIRHQPSYAEDNIPLVRFDTNEVNTRPVIEHVVFAPERVRAEIEMSTLAVITSYSRDTADSNIARITIQNTGDAVVSFTLLPRPIDEESAEGDGAWPLVSSASSRKKSADKLASVRNNKSAKHAGSRPASPADSVYTASTLRLSPYENKTKMAKIREDRGMAGMSSISRFLNMAMRSGHKSLASTQGGTPLRVGVVNADAAPSVADAGHAGDNLSVLGGEDQRLAQKSSTPQELRLLAQQYILSDRGSCEGTIIVMTPGRVFPLAPGDETHIEFMLPVGETRIVPGILMREYTLVATPAVAVTFRNPDDARQFSNLVSSEPDGSQSSIHLRCYGIASECLQLTHGLRTLAKKGSSILEDLYVHQTCRDLVHEFSTMAFESCRRAQRLEHEIAVTKVDIKRKINAHTIQAHTSGVINASWVGSAEHLKRHMLSLVTSVYGFDASVFDALPGYRDDTFSSIPQLLSLRDRLASATALDTFGMLDAPDVSVLSGVYSSISFSTPQSSRGIVRPPLSASESFAAASSSFASPEILLQNHGLGAPVIVAPGAEAQSLQYLNTRLILQHMQAHEARNNSLAKPPNITVRRWEEEVPSLKYLTFLSNSPFAVRYNACRVFALRAHLLSAVEELDAFRRMSLDVIRYRVVTSSVGRKSVSSRIVRVETLDGIAEYTFRRALASSKSAVALGSPIVPNTMCKLLLEKLASFCQESAIKQCERVFNSGLPDSPPQIALTHRNTLSVPFLPGWGFSIANLAMLAASTGCRDPMTNILGLLPVTKEEQITTQDDLEETPKTETCLDSRRYLLSLVILRHLLERKSSEEMGGFVTYLYSEVCSAVEEAASDTMAVEDYTSAVRGKPFVPRTNTFLLEQLLECVESVTVTLQEEAQTDKAAAQKGSKQSSKTGAVAASKGTSLAEDAADRALVSSEPLSIFSDVFQKFFLTAMPAICSLYNIPPSVQGGQPTAEGDDPAIVMPDNRFCDATIKKTAQPAGGVAMNNDIAASLASRMPPRLHARAYREFISAVVNDLAELVLRERRYLQTILHRGYLLAYYELQDVNSIDPGRHGKAYPPEEFKDSLEFTSTRDRDRQLLQDYYATFLSKDFDLLHLYAKPHVGEAAPHDSAKEKPGSKLAQPSPRSILFVVGSSFKATSIEKDTALNVGSIISKVYNAAMVATAAPADGSVQKAAATDPTKKTEVRERQHSLFQATTLQVPRSFKGVFFNEFLPWLSVSRLFSKAFFLKHLPFIPLSAARATSVPTVATPAHVERYGVLCGMLDMVSEQPLRRTTLNAVLLDALISLTQLSSLPYNQDLDRLLGNLSTFSLRAVDYFQADIERVNAVKDSLYDAVAEVCTAVFANALLDAPTYVGPGLLAAASAAPVESSVYASGLTSSSAGAAKPTKAKPLSVPTEINCDTQLAQSFRAAMRAYLRAHYASKVVFLPPALLLSLPTQASSCHEELCFSTGTGPRRPPRQPYSTGVSHQAAMYDLSGVAADMRHAAFRREFDIFLDSLFTPQAEEVYEKHKEALLAYKEDKEEFDLLYQKMLAIKNEDMTVDEAGLADEEVQDPAGMIPPARPSVDTLAVVSAFDKENSYEDHRVSSLVGFTFSSGFRATSLETLAEGLLVSVHKLVEIAKRSYKGGNEAVYEQQEYDRRFDDAVHAICEDVGIPMSTVLARYRSLEAASTNPSEPTITIAQTVLAGPERSAASVSGLESTTEAQRSEGSTYQVGGPEADNDLLVTNLEDAVLPAGPSATGYSGPESSSCDLPNSRIVHYDAINRLAGLFGMSLARPDGPDALKRQLVKASAAGVATPGSTATIDINIDTFTSDISAERPGSLEYVSSLLDTHASAKMHKIPPHALLLAPNGIYGTVYAENLMGMEALRCDNVVHITEDNALLLAKRLGIEPPQQQKAAKQGSKPRDAQSRSKVSTTEVAPSFAEPEQATSDQTEELSEEEEPKVPLYMQSVFVETEARRDVWALLFDRCLERAIIGVEACNKVDTLVTKVVNYAVRDLADFVDN